MSNRGRMLFQTVLFASFGTVMYVSDLLMDALPNIHLIGMFIITFTAVYRIKALIPIYVYVGLHLFFSGFAAWSVPYLYVWTVLWGMAMLIPRQLKTKIAMPVYMVVGGLHGLMFGTLWLPSQIVMFGLDWDVLLPWMAANLPFDSMHCMGNIFTCSLCVPLIRVLRKMPGAVPIKKEKMHENI